MIFIKCFYSDAASAVKEADKFTFTFARTIHEGEYIPQNVYICDNTGLYYQKT